MIAACSAPGSRIFLDAETVLMFINSALSGQVNVIQSAALNSTTGQAAELAEPASYHHWRETMLTLTMAALTLILTAVPAVAGTPHAMAYVANLNSANVSDRHEHEHGRKHHHSRSLASRRGGER